MSPDHAFYLTMTDIVLFFSTKGFQLWLDYKKNCKDQEMQGENCSLWQAALDKFHAISEKLNENELAKMKVVANLAQEMYEDSLKCLKSTNAQSIEYQNHSLNTDVIKRIS